VHGKFDATMAISDPLEVCGPIKWPGDEAYDLEATTVELLAVAVFQPSRDGKVTFGFTVDPVSFTNPPAVEWETHVPATVGAWTPGLAFGLAVVRITTAGREPRWVYERWSDVLTLF